jgi:hypothetical protein
MLRGAGAPIFAILDTSPAGRRDRFDLKSTRPARE